MFVCAFALSTYTVSANNTNTLTSENDLADKYNGCSLTLEEQLKNSKFKVSQKHKTLIDAAVVKLKQQKSEKQLREINKKIITLLQKNNKPSSAFNTYMYLLLQIDKDLKPSDNLQYIEWKCSLVLPKISSNITNKDNFVAKLPGNEINEKNNLNFIDPLKVSNVNVKSVNLKIVSEVWNTKDSDIKNIFSLLDSNTTKNVDFIAKELSVSKENAYRLYVLIGGDMRAFEKDDNKFLKLKWEYEKIIDIYTDNIPSKTVNWVTFKVSDYVTEYRYYRPIAFWAFPDYSRRKAEMKDYIKYFKEFNSIDFSKPNAQNEYRVNGVFRNPKYDYSWSEDDYIKVLKLEEELAKIRALYRKEKNNENDYQKISDYERQIAIWELEIAQYVKEKWEKKNICFDIGWQFKDRTTYRIVQNYGDKENTDWKKEYYRSAKYGIVMNCSIYKMYPWLKLTKEEVLKWATGEEAYNNYADFMEKYPMVEPSQEVQENYPVERVRTSDGKKVTALYHFQAADKMMANQYWPHFERARWKTDLQELYPYDIFINHYYH